MECILITNKAIVNMFRRILSAGSAHYSRELRSVPWPGYFLWGGAKSKRSEWLMGIWRASPREFYTLR